MAKVLLGVTGSVAAILTPPLYQALKEAGHQVKVVATAASLYFFDPAELEGMQARPSRETGRAPGDAAARAEKQARARRGRTAA